jgi:hypothetical protein
MTQLGSSEAQVTLLSGDKSETLSSVMFNKWLKLPKHCISMIDRVIEMVLIKELLSTFKEEVRNALSVS